MLYTCLYILDPCRYTSYMPQVTRLASEAATQAVLGQGLSSSEVAAVAFKAAAAAAKDLRMPRFLGFEVFFACFLIIFHGVSWIFMASAACFGCRPLALL